MRALIWVTVAVMALTTVVGCAKKKEEELPAMDPAMIEAPPAEARPAVEVETPPPPPPPPGAQVGKPAPAAGQTYTVQKGDTLYGLARRFYGDGKLWTRIADANKDKIRNATTIPAGAVLVIPPK